MRLAMWSGPRNISTALMRSWENRDDCVVVDEPFYAYYLAETGSQHPGRVEVIEAGETDWRRVVTGLVGSVPAGTRIHYQKHMAHHLLPHVERRWLTQLTNVLLIRDPAEVVASYRKSRTHVVAADLGVRQQRDLYVFLSAQGAQPPVVDAADFLRDPPTHLEWLCDLIGVRFSTAMLSWPPGPRASDGVWAPYWYDKVLASTGFAPYRRHSVDLGAEDAAVAAVCRPAYDELADVRLRL
ncbi:MAG: HAD family hydrolase [Actinomycetota bacterium]|nr:HAD family hydrolase [Actinomycetota bacterium]